MHNFLRIVLLPTRILLLLILNNNAYHTAIAVIDNFLKGILELCLAVLSHLGDLGLHAVLHDLLHGFPEYAGLPYPVLLLGAFLYVGDQIPGLLLAPHNGCDLRLDVGLDQIDGRGLGMDLDAVFIAMADQLRFL